MNGKFFYKRCSKDFCRSHGRHYFLIHEEEDLVARAARKKRRYSSCEGEISEAPASLLRDYRGRHRFRSDRPNELWITGVAEFRIPAGKAYLPPIVDCSGGMPLSWPVSTSPDAGMANSSLPGACRWLGEGDHPRIRSDRGCHYRWPGWIRICDESGLARSMPGKGCSPDSARCEGFFGRLKTEFFHGCGWAGVTIEKLMDMLDAYLRWYRDARIKGDLDCRSPMQYRRDLGCWQRRMDSVQDSHRNPAWPESPDANMKTRMQFMYSCQHDAALLRKVESLGLEVKYGKRLCRSH